MVAEKKSDVPLLITNVVHTPENFPKVAFRKVFESSSVFKICRQLSESFLVLGRPMCKCQKNFRKFYANYELSRRLLAWLNRGWSQCSTMVNHAVTLYGSTMVNHKGRRVVHGAIEVRLGDQSLRKPFTPTRWRGLVQAVGKGGLGLGYGVS